MLKISRFIRTIIHLRLKQILFRLIKSAPSWVSYKIDYTLPDIENRQLKFRFIEPILKNTFIDSEHQICLFNKKISISDRDWSFKHLDKLLRYNINYFDFLHGKKNRCSIVFLQSLIIDWVENYPVKNEGWEPYPTSLRIVNLIKWNMKLQLEKETMNSLYIQARWLRKNIEWDILGNHLFANAKAIYFAGLFFKTKESSEWLRFSTKLIIQELNEQIKTDGGHFELSPMYHSIIMEDLLDLLNISKAYGSNGFNDLLENKIKKMYLWLENMCHPDGGVSFFNDSTFGVAPDKKDLKSYATRLGVRFPTIGKSCSYLENSGYIRLENSDAVILFDCGDIGPKYQPGHAHADTLSLEMSLHGRRLVVNSGICTYELGKQRSEQRGTNAHSTLILDKKDSSETWAAFRVGRRANARVDELNFGKKETFCSASHNGYRFLRGSPRHHRSVRLRKTSLEIDDNLVGNSRYDGIINFYFNPELKVINENDGKSISLYLKGKLICKIQVLNCEGFYISQTTWHSGFGKIEKNRKLSISVSHNQIGSTRTIFNW